MKSNTAYHSCFVQNPELKQGGDFQSGFHVTQSRPTFGASVLHFASRRTYGEGQLKKLVERKERKIKEREIGGEEKDRRHHHHHHHHHRHHRDHHHHHRHRRHHHHRPHHHRHRDHHRHRHHHHHRRRPRHHRDHHHHRRRRRHHRYRRRQFIRRRRRPCQFHLLISTYGSFLLRFSREPATAPFPVWNSIYESIIHAR